MSYVERKAPVKNTCPDIDQIISQIETAMRMCDAEGSEIYTEHEIKDDIKYQLSDIPSLMEDLRNANSALREWGNSLVEALQEKEEECSDLQHQLDYLENNN